MEIGRFDRPVRVTSPPQDPRLFVVEQQTGLVRIVDANGAILPEPFLNLRSEIAVDDNERGLLSIAFAPDYAGSGLLYAYLTPPDKVEVREYRRSAADPNRAEPTGRTVFSVAHPRGNHNGGLVLAGPDGAFWFATGDGGGANDPDDNGQNPASTLGKLLRFTPGAAPEIFAIGLRNPWRFSFDRSTGDLVIADVGQGEREEVDFAPASQGRLPNANYGWRCWEGTIRTPGVVPCEAPGHVPPVHELLHDDGACSITGGVVVRDPGIPSLAGRYLYGDVCKPRLRSITLPAASDDREEATLPVAQVVDVSEDACGRVVVSSLGGSVYRLVEGQPAACDPLPPAEPGGGSALREPAPCGLSARLPKRRSARSARRGFGIRTRALSACRVSATVTIPRIGRLSARPRAIVAGDRATLRLRAGSRTRSRLRRALRRRRSVRATAIVRGVSAEGVVTTLRGSLRISR